MKTSQRRVLTLVAAYIAVWQLSVLIRVLNHEHSGTWVRLLRDAGHNIFGIPLWAWLLGGIALAAIAILAAPELLAFLPEIGEAAAEGAGLEAETAESALQSLASKVNPLGGDQNCAWAAREVDQGLADMFAGRTPEPYAPDWFEPNMNPSEIDMAYNHTLEEEYGSFFQESSMERITEQLQAAGDGARGIVRVVNGSTGHVFNAVNYGGEVFFVDGQAAGLGQSGVWTSSEVLPGGWGAANPDIWFLPTSG